MDLTPYLDDLERRIDPRDEARLEHEWLDFCALRGPAPFFAPSRAPRPAGVDWPHVFVNDAFDDLDLMVYSQLRAASETLAEGGGELLAVRANYGTGIIPTMFGAELFMSPREHDMLPGTKPLPGGGADVAAAIAKNDVDFGRGLAGKVFAFADRYRDATRDYPAIRRHVHVYNPDLQGPLPLAEVLWGSDIYMEMYDDEDAVHAALDCFTDVFIAFLAKWKKAWPDFDAEHAVEWGLLHRGGVIIRNDAAMNISGDTYREFVMPRDQRILDAFGGGVHFCGRGEHYVEHLAALRNISTLNLSQPECNDMETIYRNSVDKDIVIIGLRSDEVRRAVTAGRDLKGRVNSGASLAAWVDKDKR